jgi:hypothetical protein
MQEKSIFIHIPKTGGTSINSAIQSSNWQTEPNFFYRHILLKTKKSNSGDIFDPVNFEKYKEYDIFMMLRHPVDRLVSEYYFIQERKNFINLLTKRPSDFNDYIKNYQTKNGVVNFLKGRRFFSTRSATKEDLDDIINAIDQIPVHVGIFEEFALSMQLFSDEVGIEWDNKMDVKRMTFKRPDINQIPEDVKQLIIENNQLDVELYNHCLAKFNIIKESLKKPKIIFNKDKYAHVLPYAANTCFFEFSMDNKKFIKQNFHYFKELTFYLFKDLKIVDGYVFTKTWNTSFINAVNAKFPNSDFTNSISNEFKKNDDPLEQTFLIAKAVDDFFKLNKNVNQYYSPLQFDKEKITIESTNKQKGFFSKLFGR